jgi:hypothetical protein
MCKGGVGNIDVQGCKVLEDQGPKKYVKIQFEQKLEMEGGNVLHTFQKCSNGVERCQATGLVEHFETTT